MAEQNDIQPGDTVIWESKITDRRHEGTVFRVVTDENDQSEYWVRGARRTPIRLSRERITKVWN